MIFRPYYYFETGCAAYLFGCGSLGKCAVVDAHERDVDEYAAFAASKGMRITHVIDSHVHADHRSGGPALAKKVGAAYCLHESADVAIPFDPLRDGQEVELGNTRVQKFDANGAFLGKWGSYGYNDGQFWNPTSIAVDAAGYVYVGEGTGARLQKFTPEGAFMAKWAMNGAGPRPVDTGGVAVDAAGKVYVSDNLNHKVQVFSPQF